MTPIPEEWELQKHRSQKLKRRNIMNRRVPKQKQKAWESLKQLNGLSIFQG
jgi:hypothetical protein